MVFNVRFGRLHPTPDPLHGTPISRSSHGLSALPDNNGNFHRLVLYGGEHVARTPITDAGQVLWLAEKDLNAESEGGSGECGGWRWISLSSNGQGQINPPSRVAHAQAAVGKKVYIFGGRGGIDIGETALNDLWKLEIVGGCTEESGPPHAKWTQVDQKGDIPEARSFHKMISIGTDLYVFGGCGASGRLSDLWKFDTVDETWESLGKSAILRGRGGPNLFALSEGKDGKSRLAVVAGFAGEETNDGHIFDGTNWEPNEMAGISSLRPRSVCAFGSLPALNKCFLFGGEVDPSNRGHEGAGHFEGDLVLFNGENGKLVDSIRPEKGKESSWPKPRGWSDAAVGGDLFYIFGGLEGDDVQPLRLDDLWECQIEVKQKTSFHPFPDTTSNRIQ